MILYRFNSAIMGNGSFLWTQVLSLEISNHLYNLHPCNKSLWMSRTAEHPSSFYEIKPLGKTHKKKKKKQLQKNDFVLKYFVFCYVLEYILL